MAGRSPECNREVVDNEIRKPSNQKSARKRKNTSSEVKKSKITLLALQKPSYCLNKVNGGFSHGDRSIRFQNRNRLLRLLQEYMRRHMWNEACAVLSVLQQATVKDVSSSLNRTKFKGILQLLCHTNLTSFQEIWKIYDLWCKRLSNPETKERLLVQSESIIHCLQLGELKVARQAALGLMQERGFESDPYANWVVGLVFCRLLYSSIPEELQLTEMGSSFSHTQSQVPLDFILASNKVSDQGTASFPSNDDFATSVAFGKEDEDKDNYKNEPVNVNIKEEISQLNLEPLNMKSAGEHKQSSDYTSGGLHASIFCTQGLPLWLFPINLSSSDEDLEAVSCMQGKLNVDYHKSAVKHLRAALYLKPPINEAFLPLIQMLLIGDQVDAALDEVEKICNSSASESQLRIKAHLLEYLDRGNHDELRDCYENIMKKKPSCSYSLERLISMHEQGIYDTINIVKMIALHLDASSGSCNTWKCLASCFLKLCECEMDRTSTCNDASSSYNKIPELFTTPPSKHVWKVRAKWWINRHFDSKNMQKDTTSDDLKMLTYKASVGSYIYGRDFGYVASAFERLEVKDDMELYSVLQMHALNSLGFYSFNHI